MFRQDIFYIFMCGCACLDLDQMELISEIHVPRHRSPLRAFIFSHNLHVEVLN